ncbi:MAG: Ig-like domain-containing protein [Gemmatimonadaceae bacterium]|nr:Ig-like domain-containing protein [Gemmatimonadaceae bacterium]
MNGEKRISMLLLPLFGLMVACGDATTGVEPNAVEPASESGAPVAAAMGGLRVVTLGLNQSTVLSMSATATRTFWRTSRTSTSASWRTVDATVATVSSSGRVTGKMSGGTLVTASAGAVVDSFVVRVGTGPAPLRFSADSILLNRAGDSVVARPTDPRYAPAYSSLNSSVAAVSGAGVVRGVAAGRTSVQVTNLVGALGTLVVAVGSTTAPPSSTALSFGVDSVVLTVGQSVTKFPTGGTSAVTLTSRNTAVATVSQTGVIAGVAVGRASVLASSSTNTSAELEVIVKAAPAGTDPVSPPPPVTPPPVTPPPPTQGLSIAASVRRRTVGTGTVLVSSAIPLKAGVLAPGNGKNVHVIVGGVELQVYAEELKGRHADGTLRSVLVQFPYALTSSVAVAAQVVISSTPRSLADLAKPADDRADPAAVILPTDPTYLVTTDLVGPTVTAAEAALQLPTYGRQFDDDFVRYAEVLYTNYGDNWTENYYDRAQIYYAMWARTGNPLYWDRGTKLLLSWRRGYLEANAYGTSPHQSQVDGLGLHYLLTGDEQSRYAVTRITQIFTYFRSTIGLGTKTHGDIENRIRARVLMAHLWAWRLADNPTTLGTGSM